MAATYRAALHMDQNLTAAVSAASTLPVTWTFLTATCERNATLLKWGTSNEENNNHFVIERKNNDSQWIAIGKIKGAGNNSSDNHYEFNDATASAKSEYRIRQVDDNGRATYSKGRYSKLPGCAGTKVQRVPKPGFKCFTNFRSYVGK